MCDPAHDFILAGAAGEGSIFYVSGAGSDRSSWTAYDRRPGGELVNPRPVVLDPEPASWRGLPELP